jgi:hypothetical protein
MVQLCRYCKQYDQIYGKALHGLEDLQMAAMFFKNDISHASWRIEPSRRGYGKLTVHRKAAGVV